MKSLFKDLQKAHMKKVKDDLRSGEEAPRAKGFVKDCLLRVELKEEWEESRREGLKVCGPSKC